MIHSISRRHFFLPTVATLHFGLRPGILFSQPSPDPPEDQPPKLMSAATRQAVQRGLESLKTRQQNDGAFGPRGYARGPAVAAIAGMAFMSAGSSPGRGPYGQQVNRCISYLLANTQPSGYITIRDDEAHGRMYGHGFATLFLAQAYGMTSDTAIRTNLSKAVNLILRGQNPDGGWRYTPTSPEADISVTICQIMALRAARNAGIAVPIAKIEKCIEYVKRCQNADGGFMYMLNQPGESRFPRSAAGIVALYSAGIYQGEEIENGLSYLMQHLPPDSFDGDGYFFYGHYYAAQAMWHAGAEKWQRWYPAISSVLLKRQNNNGSWDDPIGAAYGTAMACIILQMPNSHLPIFQR
ncbi:MAG: terpene cyclase/mutase family protein [Pirellulaceae bacterium]|nr:terpene cyclase/mutase family protein [Pirellulaceae bacterium]